MNEIVCAGSVALDTTRTHPNHVTRSLGGAASYFSYSASFFAPVHVVSAVGGDFPEEYVEFLSGKPGVHLEGVQKISGGKTFHFDSEFSDDFSTRTALRTDLNVLGDFTPAVPPKARSARFVYLATMPPAKQAHVLSQMESPGLVFADSIEYYIDHERKALGELIGKLDGLVINDAEARALSGTRSLVKAGRALQEMGPRIVIIKKGEHGSLAFLDRELYPFPAFPLEDVRDPTGAGDAFAGGVMGFFAKGGIDRTAMDSTHLRTAVAYGTVMGSFAVEGLGFGKLRAITSKEIGSRLELYRSVLVF